MLKDSIIPFTNHTTIAPKLLRERADLGAFSFRGWTMKARLGRQEAIRQIVRSESVRTQRDLVARLKDEGFICTQATVSRDIADMGLTKLAEGAYVLAEDLHLQRMLSEFVVSVTRAENMTVIKCQPGTASGVASAVDSCDLDHVVGSLAGNDTVFIVSDTGDGAESLVAQLMQLANVG